MNMATELQTRTDSLPEELLGLTEEDAGRGVSFDQEDQLIPLIYVLQSNSPVVEKRNNPNYVEGAEPGHFWLRNSIHPIANGEEGIEVIPCGMQRTWIEWLPQRQGFVTRHSEPPADMETRTVRGDDGRERSVLARPNGNFIQDTREFYLLVDGQPYVLPCSGTKHSFARQWQSMFHQFRHPKTNDVMPSYARKYRLTTVPASNALGKWYGIRFSDLGFVNTPEYKAARALNDAVAKGTKRAEAPVEHGEPGPTTAGPGGDEGYLAVRRFPWQRGSRSVVCGSRI